MPRLIDADKLKNHYAWWEIGDGEITYAEAKKRFDTIIDVQPTVDAVEVVRCKDCLEFKYCMHNEHNDPNGFCAWGRKKDAEEE